MKDSLILFILAVLIISVFTITISKNNEITELTTQREHLQLQIDEANRIIEHQEFIIQHADSVYTKNFTAIDSIAHLRHENHKHNHYYSADSLKQLWADRLR